MIKKQDLYEEIITNIYKNQYGKTPLQYYQVITTRGKKSMEQTGEINTLELITIPIWKTRSQY